MNRVFKALSDPTRRRVLQLLRERPMSAGELSEHFPVSKPTMSAHFAVLKEDGELGPLAKAVMHGLSQQALRQDLRGERFEPDMEPAHERRGLFGAPL